MANITDDEIVIIIAKQHYALRPSIGALCRIERRANLTIAALIAMLYASGVPILTLRSILREGMKAADNALDDSAVSDEQLKTITPQQFAFLLQGIGYEPMYPDAIDADTLQKIRQPDWQDMFKTYVGIMGRPVQEFWRITMAEYAAAFEGFCMAHKIDVLSALPLTSQDVAELLQQFPDKIRNTHATAASGGG